MATKWKLPNQEEKDCIERCVKAEQDLRDTLDLLDEMRGRFLVRDNDIKTRVNNHLKKFK